jgi:hypothetical protein
MEIILVVIIYVAISLFFIHLCNKAEKQKRYDTTNCRNVRAQLGMFAYMSDIEKTRKKLNRKNKIQNIFS